jgi:predicted nucleic acid-binding protein
MSPILVDSSVWVDFYKGVTTRATMALDRLLGEQEVVLGDLILMEVLQGFRLLREARVAEATFSQLRCFDLGGERMARTAAANYRLLRSSGVTPRSSIDVLIATFCIEEGLELLADDRDFTLMSPQLGLQLHPLVGLS